MFWVATYCAVKFASIGALWLATFCGLTYAGISEQAISNNGPQFTSLDFVEFMRANGIQRRGQIQCFQL